MFSIAFYILLAFITVALMIAMSGPQRIGAPRWVPVRTKDKRTRRQR